MALTVRNMAGNADVPGALGTLFTTSAGQDVIQGAAFCNHTASAQTLTVYKVPAAATASALNALYSALAISANATVVATALLNQVFDVGDKLQAVASLSASISVNIGGSRVA